MLLAFLGNAQIDLSRRQAILMEIQKNREDYEDFGEGALSVSEVLRGAINGALRTVTCEQPTSLQSQQKAEVALGSLGEVFNLLVAGTADATTANEKMRQLQVHCDSLLQSCQGLKEFLTQKRPACLQQRSVCDFFQTAKAVGAVVTASITPSQVTGLYGP